MSATDRSDAIVRRGQESWIFIYIVLGFALTIEGLVFDMIFYFPTNFILYIVVGAATFWLCLYNEQFQNALIEWKNRYENQAR
jgi:hypothetical protein